MTSNILIIENEPVHQRLLKSAVEHFGYAAHVAVDADKGLEQTAKPGSIFDAIIVDIDLPETNGLQFIDAARARGLQIPIIVQAANERREDLAEAMRRGAFDFVPKPFSFERLGKCLTDALKVKAALNLLHHQRSPKLALGDITSSSPDMQRILDLCKRASQSDIPIVLEGERGVGKRIIAKAIHTASKRASKPFVTVNCRTLDREQIETVLFGPEALSGEALTTAQPGKFVQADGGTLFLNDVGALPREIQSRLLRAVQHGEVGPISSENSKKVDVRLISATNENLIDAVKNGNLREDLYYRLNVFPIVIPALKKRKEDIAALAQTFAERTARALGQTKPPQYSPDAIATLTGHEWPGNILELEEAVQRAVILCDGGQIDVSHFPQIAVSQTHLNKNVPDLHQLTPAPNLSASHPHDVPPRADITPQAIAHTAPQAPGIFNGAIASVDANGEIRPLADIEEELIRFALKFYHGQMSQVARKLGIGRSTLYRKIKDYDIDPDHPIRNVA